MAHLHTHAHDDDTTPLTSGQIRLRLRLVIGLVALAAAVGMVLLWPDADRPVLADRLGLAGELVDATVTEVETVPCRGTVEEDGTLCTEMSFEVTSGLTKGDEGALQVSVVEETVEFAPGDRVVLNYQEEVEPPFDYQYKDFQRRSPMVWLVVAFVAAVLALGRVQGARALAGLVVSGVVLVGFMFPAILDGADPTAVALVAAVVIGISALYLTHGMSDRTTVALLGTFGALALTAVLAAVFASFANFTGFNTQDTFFLQIASAKVDIPGLILAGIIIGSLGVLDDVTVTQVSSVWQLHQANPQLGAVGLYRSAVSIGRDHIASAVNTLVLAYAGAALPLLLVFTQAGRRLTDVAVGEVVAIEIVRTLVGSIGLVAAVPITTALAAWVVVGGNDEPSPPGEPGPESTVDAQRQPLDEDAAWQAFGPEQEPS